MLGFDEDAYWERRREEWENPRAFRKRSEWDEDEPVYETESLYLDEEIDEIEAEYKCSMKELFEGDLMELVERFKKIIPVSAVWDDSFDCIIYQYEPEYC